ncbi:MAG: replication initiation protein [Cetobacterium sp.]|nr:replication initiation protein [Cetobacterium sp.]
MKSVVKYDNDMNTVAFGKFKEKELDLFFSICFKIRDTGTKEIILQFDELKKLSNYSSRNLERFIKDLSTTYDKMLSLNITIRHSKLSFTKFNLFSQYTVNGENKTITIQVHDKFEYILNKIMGTYTKFDLLEFISLKSAYSKNIFKLLKQWDTKKEKTFEIEKFRELLAIPIKYQMCNIDTKVLKPIMEELPQYFPNLKLEKIKTGKKVTSLKFTWSGKSEKIEPKQIDDVIDIIEITDELNNAIEKAKKNRFIEKLLTIDNIEILTQMFQENDLVKGLNWAYKEIRQDVSTLNYLIKTIRTGAEKKEKKIVVKKSKEKQTNLFDKTFEEIPFNFDEEPKEKEVQKVSKEEYEKLYKKYLKENKITHNKITKLSFDNSVGSKYEITETEPQEKIYLLDELPQEKLLSKSGKLLVGGALVARLEKLAKEMQISISHKDKIISYQKF